MDKTDAKILNILQYDSTISVKSLAEQIGLTYTPVYERIRAMELSGIIKRYAAIVDPFKVGITVFVYCNITLKEQSKKGLLDFEKAVAQFPQIIEIVSLSGSYDYMLKIASEDIQSYNNFVTTKLANIPNIGQYHSSIVLNTVKDETAFLIEED